MILPWNQNGTIESVIQKKRSLGKNKQKSKDRKEFVNFLKKSNKQKPHFPIREKAATLNEKKNIELKIKSFLNKEKN